MSTKKTDKFSFEELANRELLKQYNTLLKENKSLQSQLYNKQCVADKNLKDFYIAVDEMLNLTDELGSTFYAADYLKRITDKALAGYTIEELDRLLQNIPDYLSKIDRAAVKKFDKLLNKVRNNRVI